MRHLTLLSFIIFFMLGWLITAPAVQAQTRVLPKPPVHVVQKGETLSQIAVRYGFTVLELQQINQLYPPFVLYEGQNIWLIRARLSGEPAPAEQLGEVAPAVSTTYTVKAGDTLQKIAQAHDLTVEQILEVNSLSNPDLLYVGIELTLPAAAVLPEVQAPVVGQFPARSTLKKVVVDISEQRTYLYLGSIRVKTFVVSTGLPGQDTRPGNYEVLNKLPIGYAYTWGLTMPYWVGIYWSGSLQNGFHALPIDANGYQMWAEALGRPASYGCIILSDEDAETFYNWVEVGTEVVVQP